VKTVAILEEVILRGTVMAKLTTWNELVLSTEWSWLNFLPAVPVHNLRIKWCAVQIVLF